MKTMWVLLKWHLGFKGSPCKCSFHEASHYDASLEFDMEEYPCGHYEPLKKGAQQV